ncbi:phage baseplate protein [Aliarcobacter lanthieri]|uniref:phage baseplate protein n=1 Tax=Aliarcobacter lanthieri TaxID=1355374 RepID=UPI00047B4986|nr:hypothetical protein [Aliarcobacter lanthieri]
MFENFTKNIENFTQNPFGATKQENTQTIGIAGYKLDVRLKENPTYTTDIPDNYVEDGSYVNDHFVDKPLIVVLEGEVADLHYQEVSTNSIIDNLLPDKYVGITERLYPSYRSNQTLQRMEKLVDDIKYSEVAEYVGKTNDLYSMFEGGREKETLNFLEFIERIYNAKMPVKIETASKTYENMGLISFAPVRDQVTNTAIGYQATFKQLRFAKTILVEVQKMTKNPVGSVKNKVAPKSDKGTINGDKVPDEEAKKKINNSFLTVVKNTVKGWFN